MLTHPYILVTVHYYCHVFWNHPSFLPDGEKEKHMGEWTAPIYLACHSNNRCNVCYIKANLSRSKCLILIGDLATYKTT